MEQQAIIAVQLLLTEITKAIAREPAVVRVQSHAEEGKTIFRLHLSDSDVTWVQGSDGRTIRALRTILEATGKREGLKLELDVVAEVEVMEQPS